MCPFFTFWGIDREKNLPNVFFSMSTVPTLILGQPILPFPGMATFELVLQESGGWKLFFQLVNQAGISQESGSRILGQCRLTPGINLFLRALLSDKNRQIFM
jgi:hypothetical protein